MKQIDMRYLFLYGFVAIMLSYIVGCKTDKTTDSKTIEVCRSSRFYTIHTMWSCDRGYSRWALDADNYHCAK